MSDLATLQELISEMAQAQVREQYGRKGVILEERGVGQQARYTVYLRDVPDDTIAIKADQFPPPTGIFSNSRGECKRADYVLVAQTETVNWIVYIEMKAGPSGSREEVVQQLKGAECLLAYFRAVGRNFWPNPRFLQEEHYKQRFVVIKKVKGEKRPTRLEPPSKVHDTPENMLTFSSPPNKGLLFSALVGKA